jgi:hypothetical protein
MRPSDTLARKFHTLLAGGATECSENCHAVEGRRDFRARQLADATCDVGLGLAHSLMMEMMAQARLVAALIFLGLGGGLRAELEWRERRILLEPPVGAADVAGEFVFFNRGSTPIRVLDARSSCDCTVLAMERSVVQPGEQGKIPVMFHIGSRQGRQAVTVAVTTNEPEFRNYDLTLEIEIKDFATLTPRLLHWKVGDEPEPKIIQVTLATSFRFAGAESASRDFSVEKVGQVEQAVQLRITPRDTWAKRNGLIKIRVAKDPQPPIEILAPVRVQ